MDQYIFHKMTLSWLKGGFTNLDGGSMFGVVPKMLWSKKYPANDSNQIGMSTDPILIQVDGKNLLIDTGVGFNKMDERQLRNNGVQAQSQLEDSLASLGLLSEDIDYVLMTHMHADHASGLTKRENDQLVSTFPNAKIHLSAIEWNEVRNPNIRSRNTYWKENWEAIQSQVEIFEGELEVLPGVRMIHTGGHSEGHSIIKLEQNGETIIHMADIMPTHAHQNPLWVLAFDDYPMTSVFAKEKIMAEALANGHSFIFYHDAYYRLIKWDETGKEIIEKLERSNN
ncbi:YtnP family quorum-quenching lactonase [Paenisporosarcina sp. NPDC076898]|uniref:YtnP family quorum-quenching lactonase n=1 Tax=unclassified Paenisporosarcina TaxID=2642018 RepID=UPI003D076906